MKNLWLLLLLVNFYLTFAQAKKQEVSNVNLEKGIAIQGYDPVAYFSNKAVEGNKKFSASYHDALYYFSSESNKNLFVKNPEKYEPQYGGYCAFAMGDYGKKVPINPETFIIIDGKLYLFYNAFLNNTLKSWNKDAKNLKEKADKNWSNLINKK